MVPTRLRRLAGSAVRGSALIALAAACSRGGGHDASAQSSDAATRIAERVREHYHAADAVAAGAWTWAGPGDVTFVLVDVQSTIQGLVQARGELWAATDSSEQLLGRSDVMASAAEIQAFAFDDLTGDGLPDLLGAVADSAGVAYPIFLPGARGTMGDELDVAAPGFRFAADPEHAPQVVAGPRGACAIQLWAEETPPDGQPEGWRYLALRRGGHLAPPAVTAPVCT